MLNKLVKRVWVDVEGHERAANHQWSQNWHHFPELVLATFIGKTSLKESNRLPFCLSCRSRYLPAGGAVSQPSAGAGQNYSSCLNVFDHLRSLSTYICVQTRVRMFNRETLDSANRWLLFELIFLKMWAQICPQEVKVRDLLTGCPVRETCITGVKDKYSDRRVRWVNLSHIWWFTEIFYINHR